MATYDTTPLQAKEPSTNGRNGTATARHSRKGDRPTAAHIEALIREGDTNNGPRREKVDRLLAHYFQEWKPWIPEEFKSFVGEVIPPTIEEHHRGAWAILTEGSPTVSMTPQILGSESIETARERANLIEAFANSAWPQLEKQAQRPVFKNDIWWTLFDRSVTLVEYLPDTWEQYDRARLDKRPRDKDGQVIPPGKPVSKAKTETNRERERRLQRLKEQQPLPFYVRDLDPRQVDYWTDTKGLTEAIWKRDRPRIRVAEDYNRGLGYKDGEPTILPGDLSDRALTVDNHAYGTDWGTVKFVTHWTRPECEYKTDPTTGEVLDVIEYPGWVTYYADGEILEQHEHPYPRVPLFVSSGLPTPLDEPEKQTRSLMDTFRSLAEEKARLLTIMGGWAYISAAPMLIDEADANAPAGVSEGTGPAKPIRFVPASTIRMPRGRKLRALELPAIGETLQAQLALIQTEIDRNSPLPPVLRGLAPGAGVESGYSVNILRTGAKTALQPLLAGETIKLEEIWDFLLYLIENVIQDVVYVSALDPKDEHRQSTRTIGIGPKDIKGYRSVNVTVATDAPLHDISLMRAGIEALQAGLITKEYALEYFLKIPNASQMLEDKFLEDLWEDESMRKWFQQELIRRNQMQSTINAAAAASGQDVQGPGGTGALNTNPQGMVDAGAAGGMGLGPADQGPVEPGGPSLAAAAGPAPIPGGLQGALYGQPQMPGTAALPGGEPTI